MRQFVLENNPDETGCVIIEGKKCHYLKSVLRVAAGDMLYARLPSGELQQMTVASIGEKKIVLQVAGDNVSIDTGVKAAPISEKPNTEMWLFMFVAKPPKMELVLRQATECGASVVVPVIGTFCQKACIESAKKKSEKNDDRWNRIITEAMQQSGSPVQTKVLPCMSLADAVKVWNEIQQKAQESGAKSVGVVLYEQTAGTQNLHQALKDQSNIKYAAVAVGAEGGISPDEIKFMQDNGFIPVHFATNILRCETAALYGMAALQTVLTECDSWQFKE